MNKELENRFVEYAIRNISKCNGTPSNIRVLNVKVSETVVSGDVRYIGCGGYNYGYGYIVPINKLQEPMKSGGKN